MRLPICTLAVFVRIIMAALPVAVLAIATFHLAAADGKWNPMQVLEAVDAGDQKATMMLMQSGMVAEPMLIHTCAQKGYDTAAALLLEHGAKAGQQFEHFGTPLHTAVSNGQLKMTELLVKHGADINEANRDGYRPLQIASQNGHTEVVKFLLKKGAHVNDVPGTRSRSPNPLILAAFHNHAKIVRVLLKKGASIEAKIDGRTALYIAVERGNEEVVGVLLKAGAKHKQHDERGFTALHIAAAGSPVARERGGGIGLRGGAKAASVVELLIAHGADVNGVSGDGNTALHVAAEANNGQGASELIAAGAAVEARNGKGFTPLHSAIFNGKPEAARALLEGKADPNPIGHKGFAPMHDAANEGMVAEVQLLVAGGADTEVRDSTGATPLLLAAREGWPAVVEALLKGGADCLGRDERGVRAIHMAAAEGHVEVLRVLLAACGERGDAGVDVRSDAGHTALHAAAFEAQVEVVRLLLAHGADTAARTKEGRTALEIAQQQAKTPPSAPQASGRREPEHSVIELLLQRDRDRDRSALPSESGMAAGDACAPVELAALAGEEEGLWPWTAGRGGAVVGHVNVSVKIQTLMATTVENLQLPLYPLPVLDVLPPPTPQPQPGSSSSSSSSSSLSSPSSSSSSALLTSPHVHAAALRTGAMLADGARRTLREVKRLRRALSWQQGVSSRRFWSTHWPMTTLIEAVKEAETELPLQDRSAPGTRAPLIFGGRDEGKKGGVAKGKLLRALQSTFEVYVEELKGAIAPALGCAPAQLECPDFGVYYRIDPDQYLSYVHTDFPSDAEARWNKQRGTLRENWWNVWVLLSEKPFGHPLALLDPIQVGVTRPGYQEPSQAMREGKEGWDAFTYMGMRQGDAIVWRTTKVPHAGSMLVREGGGQWDDSGAAVQQRESLDVRCVCLPST